ncbi:MAG: hypothetical protein M3O26_17415 [Pseudomonadota bacterium]|nr:hypothetical protein [Pseudomonadota bacterium]
MNPLLDDFLVGVVLLASMSYAFYKLGPRNLRKRILALLKLKTAAAGEVQSGCGACDNCGATAPASQSPSSDIHIPVAKIGRRA